MTLCPISLSTNCRYSNDLHAIDIFQRHFVQYANFLRVRKAQAKPATFCALLQHWTLWNKRNHQVEDFRLVLQNDYSLASRTASSQKQRKRIRSNTSLTYFLVTDWWAMPENVLVVPQKCSNVCLRFAFCEIGWGWNDLPSQTPTVFDYRMCDVGRCMTRWSTQDTVE